MGIFAGLDKDKYDRQYSDTYLLNRLTTYFQPHIRRLILLTAMGLVVSVSLAVAPVIISWGIGELESGSDANRIALIIGLLVMAVAGQYTANLLRRRATSRVIGDMVRQLRKDGFSAAMNRDMAFYDENKTGKVISRITSDTEEFGQILLFSSDVVSQVVQMLILAFVLIYLNVALTIVTMIFLIPLVFVTLKFRKIAREVTRQGSRAMAEVNDNIQESVTGISVAKNFRQESMIYKEFTRVNQLSYRANLKRGLVMVSIFPILNALAGFAFGAIVYAGAISVTEGIIAVSVWYLYFQSVDRFWFPVINISTFWNQFQQAIADIERVFALIDADNTVTQTDDQPAPHLSGRIQFNHVDFFYKPDEPVLTKFSLDIPAGENVAFVGHTGAGKSSIAKLIMRFYEFQGGEICIDGRDIRSFDIQSLRKQIGFVPQSPYLFSGTIADNIRYARQEATDAEIEEIAYAIGEGEWLETVPHGLQSDVGERGSRLSIGQRQLISLLRVLVQQPAIFILDEATASIDQFTEAQIQEALELILAQSTSILIAHRLSTVRSADRIIVLKEGDIIEQGNHESLMEQGGHYAELYNTYFRHQSLSYIENARDMLTEKQTKLG